jgi:hypothetical protein
MVRIYDENLHRLYEAVVDSSAHRLERLPISFFHALARRMVGRVGEKRGEKRGEKGTSLYIDEARAI